MTQRILFLDFNFFNTLPRTWAKSGTVLLFAVASLFLSACGAQFQTIDAHAPTTSNPLEAEMFFFGVNPAVDQELGAVALPCDTPNLNGFTTFKKKEFVCSLLPGAVRMSKQVYKQRLQIKALQNKSASTVLSEDEASWLKRIKIDYGLAETATTESLLDRVDIVPLSLIITQAAIESGWGTSRAALQGKNLFGIHGSFSKDKCLTAQDNKSVCIKKYDSVVEGISDYIQFLNTKKSTSAFRQRREKFRIERTALDPLQLAATLYLYSERGEDYTRYLQNMMVEQNFLRFAFLEN